MPEYDFKSPRLYTDEAIAAGEPIRASAEQFNYAAHVMRLQAGENVLLFNGRDGEWRADLTFPAKKKLDFVPREQMREQTSAPDLHYLFAPLKHARLDYMIQKAVEMGAGVLQPIMTQHVQASRVNTDRMRTHAIEAAAQCGILSIPDCRPPMRLGDLVSGWEPTRRLIVCDEAQAAHNPIETLEKVGPGPLAILIGPEGGFSRQERDDLAAMTAVTAISLGPRILRADTAAVAALALVQATIGDWPTRG